MNTYTRLLTIFIAALSSCDNKSPTSSSAQTRQSASSVPAFQKSEYQSLSGRKLGLISPAECEMTVDKETIIAGAWSREGNKIRIVTETGGTKTVNYYRETKFGLIGNSPEDSFFTERGHYLAGKVYGALMNDARKAKAEAQIGTVLAYLQIYIVKNSGRTPSAAEGVRALQRANIVTDSAALVDPWGSRWSM